MGGNGQHRALEDISNATGGTSTGQNYVSGDQLRGNNLIVSNAVGRTDTGQVMFLVTFQGLIISIEH